MTASSWSYARNRKLLPSWKNFQADCDSQGQGRNPDGHPTSPWSCRVEVSEWKAQVIALCDSVWETLRPALTCAGVSGHSPSGAH